MKVINKPEELQKIIEELKKEGKNVGFVPTMGALHLGHVSLIKKSVLQNDITVVSVYVNPIQFGPNEDYERYPRPVEHDIKVCKDNKVDFLFLPTNKTLYNDNFSTYILPAMSDIPGISSEYVKAYEESGPMGVKGAAEAPTVPTCGAVNSAVFDATGIWHYNLPITAESILLGEVTE